MNLRRGGALCDRARAWAALAPDGELSELERKLLAAHVARCQACAAFAADVEAVAGVLREEPLETLTHPIALPSWRRRRPSYVHLRAVGAAAAVALMAIGVTARSPLPVDDRDSLRLPRVTNFSSDVEAEVAQISRAQGGPTGIARLRPGRQGLGQPL